MLGFRFQAWLAASSLTTLTSATNLFVASYAGTVSTLQLTGKNNNYSLSTTSVSNECAPNPSWLTIDASHGVLYCLNEGLTTPNGSLSSFIIEPRTGLLTHVQNTTVPSGPVNGVIFGPPAGPRAIALAHYTGHSVSTHLLAASGGNFTNDQVLGAFMLNQTGPVASRQDASYVHQVILDPTGQYILAPDLGADLIRVFGISNSSQLTLTQLSPLHASPGSGPRHATFYSPNSGVSCDKGCDTVLYVVHELDKTITGYNVTYLPDQGGLEFDLVENVTSTYGPLVAPEGLAPAEILIDVSPAFLVRP